MKKILLVCLLACYGTGAQAGESSDRTALKHHAKAAHHVKHQAHVKHHVRVAHHAVHHAHVAHHAHVKHHTIVTHHATHHATRVARHLAVPDAESARIAAKLDDNMADDSVATFQPASSPKLSSAIALIYDEQSQRPLYTKKSDEVTPIASITKLMTAMVVLDANPDMNEDVSVSDADLDSLKGTHSRLGIGTTFTRSEMLKLALMSSENRAAHALARNYPGGTAAAIAAMNAKARKLGMLHTVFRDPTGLNCENVSTASDLVKMVAAARNYKLIHQYTTTASHSVEGISGRELLYHNTNPLVKNASWEIGLSKTGFINEAGRCLVMQAQIRNRPVIIVLLDSVGKSTRIGDANRVKKWIESSNSYARRG